MSKAYKNYFSLPNMIFSLNLSPGEIAVYSYLPYCEDRKTYQYHPGYKTIGYHPCENCLDAFVSGVSLGKSPEVDAPQVNIQYAG